MDLATVTSSADVGEGRMEVSWGTKWRGFSFADVVNADPGFADHVHKFVYKTQAQPKDTPRDAARQ